MYRTIARSGSILLMLLGILVLLGWVFHVGVLTTVLPGRITMKPNTAIGFLFLGISLFLSTRSRQSRGTQLGCAICASIVISLGLLTLLEYLFHADLGIDQLLFRDVAQLSYPGRMAHITAFNFCIAGCGVLLLAFSERQARLSQGLAAVTGVSAVFAIIGYLYGVPLLYGSIEYTSMALHQLSWIYLIPFMVLSPVLSSSPWPDVPFLTSPYPGGWLARNCCRLLPLLPRR